MDIGKNEEERNKSLIRVGNYGKTTMKMTLLRQLRASLEWSISNLTHLVEGQGMGLEEKWKAREGFFSSNSKILLFVDALAWAAICILDLRSLALKWVPWLHFGILLCPPYYSQNLLLFLSICCKEPFEYQTKPSVIKIGW